jgi:tetratricopeptide (TPR) repeat protein
VKGAQVSNLTVRTPHARPILLTLAFAAWALPAVVQSDPRATAFALEQEGKNTEAEAAWQRIAAGSPSNPEPLAHIGLLEARQEHYEKAVSFYRKALSLNPEMPGLRLNMGLALFKSGEYKEAIRVFEPMLKAQSAASFEAQRLTLLVGMSHYGLGEYAAAVPYLKQASESDPKNLTLLLTLAHSCLLSKQFPCVIDAYHQMIALNAESAEADMLVGEALDAMKDSAGATREFRAAVAANPREPNVHFGLGYLLWTQKQYEEAAKEFQAELVNTPDYVQAMVYLADADIQMDRFDLAQPVLEKVVKSDPSIAMGRLDLGIVYAETGRRQDALREFKAAAALKPDDVDVHWRMARLYRSMGDKAEAEREFEESRSLTKAADAKLFEILPKTDRKGNATALSEGNEQK